MQGNDAWIALLRRIPVDLQDNLALGLTTGAEIVMQKLVKLEPDFMIIRGRLAGTQDTGRLVMVPYAQLTFIAIARILKDPEIEAIFGKGDASVVIALPPQEAAPAAEPAAAEANPTAEIPAEVSPPKKPAPVSKSVLVAKMRERLKESGK